MTNLINNNIPLFCNIPKDKLSHKYVNPTFCRKIKALKDNDR